MIASLLASLVLAAEPPDDALIRAVTQRLERDRRPIPDSGLLPTTGPLPLLQTSDARSFNSAKWSVKSAAAWQETADASGKAVYAVKRSFEDVEEAVANAGVRVEIIVPTNTPGLTLCCCSTTEVFRRVGKTWRFEKRLGTICS